MLSNKEPCTQSKGFDFSVMRAANGRYSSDSPLNKMGRSGAVVAVGIATVVIGVTVSYKFSVGGDVAFSSVHRILNVVDAEEPFPPLFPFRFADYVGFCLAILGLLLAAGAGVGGGGILVPIYALVLKFPVKYAIPLTSATVFGGAITNNLVNWRKKHPGCVERPLIDWDLMLTLEPMTIAGTLLGVVLNSILPDIVILVSMVVLLGTTAYTTFVKANSLYQKESQAMRKTDIVNEEQPLLVHKDSEKSSKGEPASVEERMMIEPESDNSLVIQQVRSDAMKLTILFLAVTVANLLKGGPQGGTNPTGFPSCGGACYWASQMTILLMIFAFTFCVRRALLIRVQNGGPTLSDIDWNAENTIKYPCYGVLAGVVAGLSGVGGGIIIGPLMLALGTFIEDLSCSGVTIRFCLSLQCYCLLQVCTPPFQTRHRHAWFSSRALPRQLVMEFMACWCQTMPFSAS